MEKKVGKLVNEMGVNLTSQAQDSYLGKARAKSDKLRSGKEKYNEIMDMFKALNWQQMNIREDSNNYYIILPDDLIAKIREFRTIDADLSSKFGKWKQLDTNNGVHMQRNDAGSFQRSHFPNDGIPMALRGVGLGYNCYRTFLQYSKYLSSNTSGTKEKDNAWASLIKKRPDPDDVHAIVSIGNVLAMLKTLPNNTKIDLAKRYINAVIVPIIGTINDRNFAIDDELKAILPEDVTMLLDPRRRQELKRRQAEERQQREATEREAAINAARSSFPRFGIGEIATNWQEGDFVFRHTYINDNNVAPRIVARIGTMLKGIAVNDYIALAQNHNHNCGTARELDTTSWTKINILNIPDINAVRFQPNEILLVNTLRSLRQNSAPPVRSDAARNLVVTMLRRPETLRQDTNFGPVVTVYNTLEYDQMIHNRPLRPEISRKLQQTDFVNRIYMSPIQFRRFQENKSSEVFAAFNGNTTAMRRAGDHEYQKAINTMTGFIVDNPETAGFGGKFEVVELRNKRDVQVGEMIYIANHPEYYGLTARVGYSMMTETQLPYVYVQIINPELRGPKARKVSISLQFVRKMRAIV